MCSLLTNAVDHPELSAILMLGHRPGATPHIAFDSRSDHRSETHGSPGLMVQIWSSGAKGVFYTGSHLREIVPSKGGHGWLQVRREDLSMESADVILFDKGGL